MAAFRFAENTDDLFVGKTLLHGDVLMWLMKTLLTSVCVNQRGAGQAYPYASAFFRRFTGSTRITIREIHYFAPVLTAQELRGSRGSWLSAIDVLIESRGTCCRLPLPAGAGQRLFPEVAFQQTERVRCQDALRDEKYTRQRHKEQCQRERAYQALAGQAETEPAFHTPETVSSWSARWSGMCHDAEIIRIHGQMEFTPVAPGTDPVLFLQPLAGAVNLQPGAVDKYMNYPLSGYVRQWRQRRSPSAVVWSGTLRNTFISVKTDAIRPSAWRRGIRKAVRSIRQV